MGMKVVGRAKFHGQRRRGCPRCCEDQPMSTTKYRGNGGVTKLCCVLCEPEVLEAKKRATERRERWRKNRPNAKAHRREEARRRREKNGDKLRAYRRKHHQDNKEHYSEYRKKYIKENPWFNRAASAKRRAVLKLRMVEWSDLEKVAEVYRTCPEGMVVDHIIPLRGEKVSGLHVPGNLQYLTAEENNQKSNKFDINSMKR